MRFLPVKVWAEAIWPLMVRPAVDFAIRFPNRAGVDPRHNAAATATPLRRPVTRFLGVTLGPDTKSWDQNA
ncbi:hypothetical protein [Brevundimonas denitrificans]|uniref:hypothetical protein n=1 Tax=Brevundimonas denitrificans TaxID=1443434 RepID=UPI00223B5042|nr:hypothetical protein [Brevundimonas denitrificans]